MMYRAANVGLSVYAAGKNDPAAAQKSTPSPPPSPTAIGGCHTKFSPQTSKPCRSCDAGWIRQPDGYGCVEWTSCYSCGGTGEAND